MIFFLAHIFIPFFKALWKYNFVVWFQTRVYVLWIYVTYLFILRNVVFNTTYTSRNFAGDGLVLAILSIFNLVLGLGYGLLWYGNFLPQLVQEKTVNDHYLRL